MSNYMEDYTQAEETRIEKEIIALACKCLLTKYPSLALDIDGEEEITGLKSAKAVLAKLEEYYWGRVYIYAGKGKDGKYDGYVRLTGGNVETVICDYTTNWEELIKPANDLAATYE